MTCPYCSAVVSSDRSLCTGCGRTIDSRRQVAAGVLTPAPIPPPQSDTEMTRFVAPGTEEPTRFMPPAGDAGATAPGDEATRFIPSSGNAGATSPGEEATRFIPPSGNAGGTTPGEEATRFVPPSGDAPTVYAPAGGGGTPSDTRPRAATNQAAGTSEDGPLHVGQTFSTRYHIIRVLGIGGMGAVYQAWDAELGMAVALKVIRPEASNDPAAAREMERRFKQELVLARKVTHKNVVRIHDMGQIDGIKYITMPYLEGSDLATVMKNSGKMPLPAALRIVRDVAAGLVAAHEAGIVHRDLKPANIMVLGDSAVIMDFGIARSSGSAAESAGTGGPPSGLASRHVAAAATVVGTVMGTVQYMAPEQARGQEVDQRADIYALGLIFLDMLLGKRYTAGAEDDSAIAELMRRMEHPPAAARTVDAGIPEAIEKLIVRCVEPRLEARFQTSAELVAELNRLDEKGEPLPIRRVIGLPLMAAVVVVLLALSVGTWWYQRQFIPEAAHEPVSVVIADFQNNTSEAAFDRTLEPMMKLALEGAGFISAYDRAGIRRSLGVQPPENLDERAAQEIAVRQGLGVVLSGTVSRQGAGYGLSVKAVRTATGEVIASADDNASSKDNVLAVATELATEVRKALGDDTSDDAQRFAMATWTANSIDVVHEYAVALEAVSNTNYDEARRRFSKTVELDPDFGPGYVGLAVVAQGTGRQQDAEKYATEAIRHVDRMTEKERLHARGHFYSVTSDYEACVKEFSELIARFAQDAAAHNNLAFCSSRLRDTGKAVNEMRQVVSILPNRSLYRVNLSLYAAYGGDFQLAEQEAQTAQKMKSRWAWLTLAFAYLGQGELAKATDAYQQLAKVDALGVSQSAAGLGDLAMYEGRYADAARILDASATADLAAKDPDRAATKIVTLATVNMLRGRKDASIAAARRALENSRAVKIRFMAAHVFVEAGEAKGAQELIAELSKELQAEPQAYAKILEGELFLKNGDARQAIASLTAANGLLDTWVGRFDLGRAYLEAGAFAQADSEFDRCLKRRGEAISLFLDEEPSYGFLPPVYYYLGRVREGLKAAGFAESYRTYLNIRGKSAEDPLVPDARRRAGA